MSRASALAGHIAALLAWIAPPAAHGWARAMSAEIDHIGDRHAALRYALGSLAVCLGLRCRHHAGPLCGAMAVLAGVGAMLALGAPPRQAAIHLLSLLTGLACLPLIRPHLLAGAWGARTLPLGAGMAMLATAGAGIGHDGAARWIAVGPLPLRPGMILLPMLPVLLSGASGWAARIGVALAAAGALLQADFALASALLAAVLVLALRQPARQWPALLMLAGLIGLGSLGLHHASGDGAYAQHMMPAIARSQPWTAALMCAGLSMLFLPLALRPQPGLAAHPAAPALAAFWITLVIPALAGISAAPIVAYGGSAVLGYLLSVTALDANLAAPESC